MSGLTLADETAGDIPVRDITLNLNGTGIPAAEKGANLLKGLLCFCHYTQSRITQYNTRWVNMWVWDESHFSVVCFNFDEY